MFFHRRLPQSSTTLGNVWEYFTLVNKMLEYKPVSKFAVVLFTVLVASVLCCLFIGCYSLTLLFFFAWILRRQHHAVVSSCTSLTDEFFYIFHRESVSRHSDTLWHPCYSKTSDTGEVYLQQLAITCCKRYRSFSSKKACMVFLFRCGHLTCKPRLVQGSH